MEGLTQTPYPINSLLWGGSLLVSLAIIGVLLALLLRQRRQVKQSGHEFPGSLASLSREWERAQKYLDTTQTLMVALDRDGNITMVNRASCDLLGYAEHELHGRNWFATCLPQPDGLESSYPAFLGIMAGDTPFCEYLENAVLCRDGNQRQIAWRNAHISDQAGKVVGVLGSGEDITERKRAEEALSRNEKSLKEAQRIAHIGNWDLDLVRNALTWSDEIYCIFEIDPQGFDASYAAFLDTVHPDDRTLVNQAYIGSVKNREPYDIVHRLQMKDGRIKYVREHCETFYDKAGTPLRSVGTVQDISEHERVEKELKLAASVFTHAREGITITDPKGTIIAVNDSFTHITGYSRDEAVGQNPRVLKSGRHGKDFYNDMWHDLVKGGEWSGEIWNRRKNGEIYPELLTISAVNDSLGQTQHYVALFSDITAQKRYQDQLERIAHYDALTDLPNRVLLAERLHQAMAQTKRRRLNIAVVYLDLDGFKEINDSYGHEVGDQFLMSLASRMQQVLREGDTIARLGGDEFVTVLVDLADPKDCVPMLNRLLASVAQPVHVDGRILQVSASLGVTIYHHDEKDDVGADQLLRQADQAMYQAKLTGKNRYNFFDTEQDRNVRGFHEDLDNIRSALNEGEFVLYYQPLVNMRTGELIGVEALIRWQHPERGLLLPDTFLPVVADHNLDIEIGEWVIDTALSQVEEWRTVGLDLPVSVNIGAYQLQQADFVDRLRSALARRPTVEPKYLEMEVLETSALEDITHVSQVMHECKAIGVNFALDDFGTGYSSLTYLKRLPSARLKIDRSFVRDMLDDPDDLAILDGVLGLAAAFRRQAVAEGVETKEQGEMLLQLGCELAQGYGISHPMRAADIPKWAGAWRPEPTWASQLPVDRSGLPLLFASVEHRAWVRAVEDYLRGNREVAPTLGDHQCRFSQWLNGEGQARYDGRPAMQAISVLHRQIHDLAADLIGLRTIGQNPEAVERLGELHSLRDGLLVHLKSIAGQEA